MTETTKLPRKLSGRAETAAATAAETHASVIENLDRWMGQQSRPPAAENFKTWKPA